METYSFTGTFGRDDEAVIDVCLFEDLPFSQDYTVINQWRVGDIMNLLIDEGHLKSEEVDDFTKVMSVRVQRFYTTDVEGLSLERPKAKLINEYTVGVSSAQKVKIGESMTSHMIGGSNYKIEDMDQKIRDIKLKRIL
jgi:hypothetical protein